MAIGATFQPAPQRRVEGGSDIVQAVQNVRTMQERSKRMSLQESLAKKRNELSADRLENDITRFNQGVVDAQQKLKVESSDMNQFSDVNNRFHHLATNPHLLNTEEGDEMIAGIARDLRPLTFSKYVASGASELMKRVELANQHSALNRQVRDDKELTLANQEGRIIEEEKRVDGIKYKAIERGGGIVWIDTGEATESRVNTSLALLNAARNDPEELKKLNANQEFLIGTRSKRVSEAWNDAIEDSSKQQFALDLAQQKSNIDVAEETQKLALKNVFSQLERENKLTSAQKLAFENALGQGAGAIEAQEGKLPTVTRTETTGSLGSSTTIKTTGAQGKVDETTGGGLFGLDDLLGDIPLGPRPEGLSDEEFAGIETSFSSQLEDLNVSIKDKLIETSEDPNNVIGDTAIGNIFFDSTVEEQAETREELTALEGQRDELISLAASRGIDLLNPKTKSIEEETPKDPKGKITPEVSKENQAKIDQIILNLP